MHQRTPSAVPLYANNIRHRPFMLLLQQPATAITYITITTTIIIGGTLSSHHHHQHQKQPLAAAPAPAQALKPVTTHTFKIYLNFVPKTDGQAPQQDGDGWIFSKKAEGTPTWWVPLVQATHDCQCIDKERKARVPKKGGKPLTSDSSADGTVWGELHASRRVSAKCILERFRILFFDSPRGC